jgi:PiT family inorganic phosphate transporter
MHAMFDWPVIIVGATLFVAYANGANDNFKGVATLFGSGIANRRAHWKMIRTILAAWVLTLPTAALLSDGVYTLLRSL